MKPFRAKDGRYAARLDEAEREVVGQLALDVAELLGATPAELAEALEPDDDASSTDPWDAPGSADPLAGLVLGGAASAASGDAPSPDLHDPEDPAVRRLLPSASDDADVAEEFRRLVQPDLRQLKIDRLLALVRALQRGDKLEVPADRADLLAGALVDIRLVLAERLGLDSDEAADALYRDLTLVSHGADGEPVVGGQRGPAAALRLHLGSAYAALTWLQESLVTVQLADLEGRDA